MSEMGSTHSAEKVTLTHEERDSLIRVIDQSAATTGHFPLRPVIGEVERIISARLAPIEALATEAEDAEAASLSRTFDGGSFGAWVDAHALRRVLRKSPEGSAQ